MACAVGWIYYLLHCSVWNAQYLVSARTIFKHLGESVTFPLSTELGNISDVTLKKNDIYLFRWSRNGTNQRYVDRLTFQGNETLQLDKLEERDGGLYKVELFDMAGTLIHQEEISIILTCLKGFHEVQGELGSPVTVFGGNLTGFPNLSDAKWEKNGSLVAQLNLSRPVYSEKPGGRQNMFPTGECRLVRVKVSDAGPHTLEVSNGYLRLRWSAQLVVRVPHPSVELSCLSDGKAEYRCLEKWGNPTMWIFNGSSLGDMVPEENELVLSSFTGKLACALREYPDRSVSVSFTCTGPDIMTTTSTILAVSCTLIVVLILSLAGFYIRLKRRRQHQSLQLTTLVPTDIIQICEVTGTDIYPPPLPTAQEEGTFYSSIGPPLEMSTFVY